MSPVIRTQGHGWRHRFLSVALLALGLTNMVCAGADSIYLRGGERLIGSIVSAEAGEIIFDSQTIGRCKIPLDHIERIERATSASVPPAPDAVLAPTLPPPTVAGITNGFLPWTDPLARSNAASDWVQLKSGEWLAGELKSMQDDKLEFDSDKLDWQEFDWQDIFQVRSPRPTELLFRDRQRTAGAVHVNRERVWVETESGPQSFGRPNLMAMTPGGHKEINYWSGKAALGMTMRSGNTEQTDASLSANLNRRTPATRLSLDYSANYTSIGGEETARNQRVTSQFDVWLTPRFFLRVPFVDYYQDSFQNIAHRGTLGAGAGYQIFDRPDFMWEVGLGPAYQQTWYESVPPGQSDSQGNAAAVVQGLLDVNLTRRVDFVSTYQLIFAPESAGGYTHHWENTFEIEVTKRLDLDVSFVWDRVSNPATSAGGTTPEPDDFRTVLSLGVNF